jgi:hypothetical protein
MHPAQIAQAGSGKMVLGNWIATSAQLAKAPRGPSGSLLELHGRRDFLAVEENHGNCSSSTQECAF